MHRFFGRLSCGAVVSLTANTTVATKVHFPREIFPFSAIVISLVDSAVATLLVMGGWSTTTLRRGPTIVLLPLVFAGPPPPQTFDVIVCFDVLEHIPTPLRVVRVIRRAMREQGLAVIHAPFADDPDHPMHVVHTDVVTPRMRSLGFQPIDHPFPAGVRPPQIYAKRKTPAIDRVGYLVYDRFLPNRFGARVAAMYRRVFARHNRRASSARVSVGLVG